MIVCANSCNSLGAANAVQRRHAGFIRELEARGVRIEPTLIGAGQQAVDQPRDATRALLGMTHAPRSSAPTTATPSMPQAPPLSLLPDTVTPMPSQQTLAALRAFVAEREWDQFHSPENLAKSISIEAAELLECFQWSPGFNQTRAEEELADVVTYCIHLANKLGVHLDEIVMSKLAKTEEKYPVELAKGRMTKYTQLVADQDVE